MTQMTKGSNIALTTSAVRVAVHWTVGAGTPDIDASALLLTSSAKVRSDEDFVSYNQLRHASGAVRHEGKSPGTTTADTLRVDLAALSADVDRVVVAAAADGGTFGQVRGLYLRLLDAAGDDIELAGFDITDASTETAFVFGGLYRRGGQWKFRRSDRATPLAWPAWPRTSASPSATYRRRRQQPGRGVRQPGNQRRGHRRLHRQ